MDELEVWINGIQNKVSGLDSTTTCRDTVIALAQSNGLTGRFNLIEKTPVSERCIHPDEHPLQILLKHGQGSPNYFILRKKGESPSSSRPSSASSQSSPVHSKSSGLASPLSPVFPSGVPSEVRNTEKREKPAIKPKPKLHQIPKKSEQSRPVPVPRKRVPSQTIEAEVIEKTNAQSVSHQPDLLVKDPRVKYSTKPQEKEHGAEKEEIKLKENEERQKALEVQREREQQIERALEEKRQMEKEQKRQREEEAQENKKQQEDREKGLAEQKEREDAKLQQELEDKKKKEATDRRRRIFLEQKRHKDEAERKRKEAQKEKEEAERKQQLEEIKKQEEEEKKRKLEAKRKEEEKRKALEEQREREKQEMLRLKKEDEERKERERKEKIALEKKQAEEKRRQEEKKKREEERQKALAEEKRKIEEEKKKLEELVKAQESRINHQKTQLSGLDKAIQSLLKFESDPDFEKIQDEIVQIEQSIQRNQAMLNEKEFWDNELELERQMHKKLEASVSNLKDKVADCNRRISQKQEEITTLSKTIKKEEKKVSLSRQQSEEVKAVQNELKELKLEYDVITANLEKVNQKLVTLDKEFQEKQKELELVEQDYEKTKELHIIIPDNKMENNKFIPDNKTETNKEEESQQRASSPTLHRVLKGSPRQLALATPSSDNPEGIFL